MEEVKLITKPTQSGKTFEMFRELIDIVNQKKEENIFNIIFCDNSLLQTRQLKERFKTVEKLNCYEDHEGNKCIIFSSDSDKANSIGKIIRIIAKGDEYKNIICCSNSTRYEDISEIIGYKIFDMNFNIFIDEADKFIKGSFFKYFEIFRKSQKVLNFRLITATPEEIIKKYEDINVKIIKEPIISDLYHGVYNVDFNISKEKYNEYKTIKYAKSMLKKHEKKHGINNGEVYFVPSNIEKVSHMLMKDILIKFGFDKVFIINGDGCIIYEPENEPYDINLYSDINSEISKKLGDFYLQNNLNEEKIAITGHYCIMRGITLNSPKMLLTHAIISPKFKNPDNIYQLVGRMFGNIKKFDIYQEKFTEKKQIIICNQYIQDIIYNKENICKNLATGKIIPRNIFSKDNNKECMTIPIVLEIDEKNFNKIFDENSRKKKRKYLVKFIRKLYDINKDNDNLDRLMGYIQYKFTAISLPNTNNEITYKNHITNIVKKFKKKEKFIVDNNKLNENCNYINCFGDKKKFRLCFVIWEGEKNK